MTIIRSWLFVPGDSDRKLEKGRDNPADALILDLEDSVSDDRQDLARGVDEGLSNSFEVCFRCE
jgi:citrate lyase subunit beta/citryl-CoA lyase